MPLSNFSAKAKESSRFVSVSCFPNMFVWHQENKNTSSKSQRDVSLLKKILVSRNELRVIENIAARDVNMFIANFLLQVHEFLFLICVWRTISMKILVLRVLNSSRHRECFVRGYLLFAQVVCVKSPHSLIPGSFGFLTQTTRAYNLVRRTFYDVNYTYSIYIIQSNLDYPDLDYPDFFSCPVFFHEY